MRTNAALQSIITVLALADGFLHLSLDFLLFRGNLLGAGSPPGPFSLPLNRLFLLNFVGYVVLVIVFWVGSRWPAAWRSLVDVALIVYAAAAIAGWVDRGGPNPMGLGYLAKGIEVVLIIALVVHASSLLGAQSADETTA